MRPPGSGTKISKDGKTYWRLRVSLHDEYGRTSIKTFERRSLIDAQNAARIYLAERGRTLQTEGGTLRDLFELVEAVVWSKSGDAHLRSRKLYRAMWEKVLGDMQVSEITTPLLTRALTSIAGGKSLSTISKARDTVRSALAYAVSDLGWITHNPATGIRSPKARPSHLRYPPMSQEEYDRVIAHAEGRILLALRLMGECAMRPSESIRVRPEHLFSVHDHWMVQIPKSKTAAGIRSVPVSDELARLIEQGQDWSDMRDPLDHLRKFWRKYSDTRMYDLRGWRSDEWRRKGVPAQLRTYLLGHTKETFTQRVYETMTEAETLKMIVV